MYQRFIGTKFTQKMAKDMDLCDIDTSPIFRRFPDGIDITADNVRLVARMRSVNTSRILSYFILGDSSDSYGIATKNETKRIRKEIRDRWDTMFEKYGGDIPDKVWDRADRDDLQDAIRIVFGEPVEVIA